MKLNNLVVNPLSRVKLKKIKDESGEGTSEEVILPRETGINHIKCKAIRLKKNEEIQREKKKAKKERRKARLQANEPKQVPHTIESLREKDETMIHGDINSEENEEVKIDLEHDEFASYYKQEYEPKVLITYSDNPHTKTRIFGRELTRIIPNSTSLYRNRSGIKKIVKSCVQRNFTDIIVINENQCKPSILFKTFVIIIILYYIN
jgi:ribosome production factor 1